MQLDMPCPGTLQYRIMEGRAGDSPFGIAVEEDCPDFYILLAALFYDDFLKIIKTRNMRLLWWRERLDFIVDETSIPSFERAH